jgi:hypothetical protein
MRTAGTPIVPWEKIWYVMNNPEPLGGTAPLKVLISKKVADR